MSSDTDAVPDDVLNKTYLDQPQATLAEARAEAKSLTERRAVEDLVKAIRHLNSDLRKFDVNFHDTPNIHDLRRALVTLIDTAQTVEERVVAALKKPEVA